MRPIQTKYFGEVDPAPDGGLEFPRGLPGFESEVHFVLLDQPSSRPLLFLQSLATPDLCFVALPVASVESQYRLNCSPEDLAAIGLPPYRQPQPGEVLSLAILSFAYSGHPTANLLSPVLINLANRKAIQAIQNDSRYSFRHPLCTSMEGAPC